MSSWPSSRRRGRSPTRRKNMTLACLRHALGFYFNSSVLILHVLQPFNFPMHSYKVPFVLINIVVRPKEYPSACVRRSERPDGYEYPREREEGNPLGGSPNGQLSRMSPS